MADYTAAQITDMLTFLKANPAMLDNAMIGMMRGMIGAGDVQSSLPELKAKETEIAGLKAKIVELEKGAPVQIESAVRGALQEQAKQLEATKKHEEAIKVLTSSVRPEIAQDFLSKNPSDELILSYAKGMKAQHSVGASSGEQIDSSRPSNYEALNKRFNKRLGR